MRMTNKSSECRRISKTISNAVTEMGLSIIDTHSAGCSASKYIFVSQGEEPPLKIRISDHDPKYNDNDVHIFVYPRKSETTESIIRGIEKIAYLTQNIVPKKYTRDAFEKRTNDAQKSTITKMKSKNILEKEMTKTVIDELLKERLCNRVIAGKIIDRLFPDIPRAQRQRIADASSFNVKKIRYEI